MQVLLAVVGLYLLAVAWMVSRLVIVSMKVDSLREWQAAHAPGVDLVHEGRAKWQDLAPVVDTSRYPLELLLHVQQALPADLHLTLFEVTEDHLRISGESKTPAGAFQFFDTLKSDSSLSGYTLNMGNPRLLPNDLAQFQIEGIRADNH
jgi:hypothetical protein